MFNRLITSIKGAIRVYQVRPAKVPSVDPIVPPQKSRLPIQPPPHQSAKECARRVRQMQRGIL